MPAASSSRLYNGVPAVSTLNTNRSPYRRCWLIYIFDNEVHSSMLDLLAFGLPDGIMVVGPMFRFWLGESMYVRHQSYLPSLRVSPMIRARRKFHEVYSSSCGSSVEGRFRYRLYTPTISEHSTRTPTPIASGVWNASIEWVSCHLLTNSILYFSSGLWLWYPSAIWAFEGTHVFSTRTEYFHICRYTGYFCFIHSSISDVFDSYNHGEYGAYSVFNSFAFSWCNPYRAGVDHGRSHALWILMIVIYRACIFW